MTPDNDGVPGDRTADELLETEPETAEAVEEAEEELDYTEEPAGARAEDRFQNYATRVQQYRRLGADEEQECSKRIQAGLRSRAWLTPDPEKGGRLMVATTEAERDALVREHGEVWSLTRTERLALPMAFASLMLSSLAEHRDLYRDLRQLEFVRDEAHRTRRARKDQRAQFGTAEEQRFTQLRAEADAVAAKWTARFEEAIAAGEKIREIERKLAGKLTAAQKRKAQAELASVKDAAQKIARSHYDPLAVGAFSVLIRVGKARVMTSAADKKDRDRSEADIIVIGPKEEHALRELQRQGTDARNFLIERNLRLVMFFCNKYWAKVSRSGIQFDDLVGFGNGGLINAADRFDFTKKTRFSTYASDWIRQGITRGITETRGAIKIPGYIADLQRKVTRMQPVLTQRYGRPPTETELAEAVNRQTAIEQYRIALGAPGDETVMPDEELIPQLVAKLEPAQRVNETGVRTLLEYTQPVVSLDKPIGEGDDEELTVGSTITDRSANVEEAAERAGIRQIFDKACDAVIRRDTKGNPKRAGEPVLDAAGQPVLDKKGRPVMDYTKGPIVLGMDPRKRKILEMRFYQAYTLDQCALELDLTRERVRQLEEEAMEEFLAHVDKDALEPYAQEWRSAQKRAERQAPKPAPQPRKRGRPPVELIPPSSQGLINI